MPRAVAVSLGPAMAALEQLTSLVATLCQQGVANSTLARVYAGLGIVRCHQGDYELGKTEFWTSYSISRRLGNEAQPLFVAANLAVCCYRLGEFDELLDWTEKASGGDYSGYLSLQVAYYRSCGLALTGRTSEALNGFKVSDSQITQDAPLWLIQAWRLLSADILCLCGQHNNAINQARDALPYARPTLQAASFAGVFFRWLAIISRRDGTTAHAKLILDGLGSRASEFDAVDRAEITCACLLMDREPNEESALLEVLAQYLSKLPSTVESQLVRLGVMHQRKSVTVPSKM